MEPPHSVNYPYFDLIDSIFLFASAKPDELPKSPEEFVRFLNRPVDPAVREEYEHHIRCLALQQVANPILDSLREGISNACDAQAVAKREMEHVQVTLQGRKLTIGDKGTGLGYKGIPRLIVPGLTSNPEMSFNIEKGLAGVVGRFGQGFQSLYYYLTYHWKEKPKPQFSRNAEGDSEIHLPLLRDGHVEDVVFRKSPGKPVCIDSPVPHPLFESKKKLVFWTKQGDTSFKITFKEEVEKKEDKGVKEEKRRLVWRLKPKEKLMAGSDVTVCSPLLENHFLEVVQGLSTMFEHLMPTPLFVNGKQVNTLEGLKRVDFPGVTLLYSPEQVSEGGKLVIAEKGRPVVTFPQDNGVRVPKVLVVSFNALPLSHERSTLNWKAPKQKEAVIKLVNEILRSQVPDKIVILNALTIILKEDCCNVLKEVSAIVPKLAPAHPILPATPEVEAMGFPEAVYVHPDYFKTLTQGCNRFSTESSQTPIAYVQKGDNRWLFHDKRLFPKNNPQKTYFNRELMLAWLKARGHEGSSFHLPEPNWKDAKPDSVPPGFSPGDFFSPENDSKTVDPETVKEYLETNFQIRFRDQDLVIKALIRLAEWKIPRSTFLYLCDLLFVKHRERVQKMLNEDDSSLHIWLNSVVIHKAIKANDFEKQVSLQMAAVEIGSIFEKLIEMPQELKRRCFCTFLSKNLEKNSFSNNEMHEQFLLYYSVIEETDCTDITFATSFFERSAEKLLEIPPAEIKQLLVRLPIPQRERCLTLFRDLHIHPQQFHTWSDSELVSLIDDLPIDPGSPVQYVRVRDRFYLNDLGQFPRYRMDHIHLLYQHVPSTYRRLRQLLFPYLFNALSHI
ncbi:MAG: hypothetical protein LLG04_09190, partial [Parachlamydia sp.]|nr:hypothetical protein [Parachlamydia sp.]